MNEYLDKNENYSITHYQIAKENIIVWFKGRRAYSYSYKGEAGKTHVENMKVLAIEGRGLCEYIHNNVWAAYDE
jgi:hypothetical protein